MKTLVFLLSIMAPPALAHAGHVADVAGHAHWIGLGAILGAAALAGRLGAKGKRDDEAVEEEAEPEAEECPA